MFTHRDKHFKLFSVQFIRNCFQRSKCKNKVYLKILGASLVNKEAEYAFKIFNLVIFYFKKFFISNHLI